MTFKTYAGDAGVLSRRLFLGVATAALGAYPLTAFAQDLPPAETPGVPVPPGQIDMAVGELDRIVKELMSRSKIPGAAVAVVHEGRTVYAKGFGERKIGLPEPVTPDTVFQLASLSKPVGASVIARQVTLERVSWQSRMKDLLPWFELADPARSKVLTVADLYSHRSGLPAHAGDDLEDLGFNRQTVLERLRLLPLSPFRITHAYTNFGMTAAAEAVARAAGTDWASLSEEAIYRPLGMASTSSRFKDYMAAANRAVPHARSGDGFSPLFQREPDAQSPAGGVSSTVNDLAIWMKMILADGNHEGTEWLSPTALLPAVSPQSVSSPPRNQESRPGFYGYGFNVGTDPSGRTRLSHSGAFVLGAGTCFTLIPSLDLGIVVLTNAAPVGAAESIAASFTDLAQFGHETRDWYAGYSRIFAGFFEKRGRTVGMTPPENAAPPPAANRAVGVYTHPYFGRIEIGTSPRGLTLAAGPKPMEFLLLPFDGPVMVFDFVTENAPSGSRSTITFGGPAGPAETVEIELFGEEPATFTRV
ncbi:serine hydrolase domain-containing protein [Roseibium sp.]|uniref:serine hydrolase domain-containing protein n=1 Tax=Roseibium sp. TaxID=1936156 RepID=UPI003262E7D3